MKPSWWFAAAKRIRKLGIASLIAAFAASQGQGQAASLWDQPAASLASKIADLMGPGTAALTVRNLSSIPSDQVPAIRKSLEAALKAHGVMAGGSDSANSIRVTLSENSRERLWVAELIEGNETKVAMVELGSIEPGAEKSPGALALRRQPMLLSQEQEEPILAALEVPSGLLVLEPDQLVLYARTSGGLKEQQRARLEIMHTAGRDPRGVILGSANGSNFDAWLPGIHCSGSVAPAPDTQVLKVGCSASDDPWAVTQPPMNLVDSGSSPGSENVRITPISAFYNASRNSFTGVLIPGSGVDLPPFYSLAVVPRAAGAAVLADGVNGKVQLVENGALHTITGTRDWGSDLAVLRSGCGAGAQVIVSGSGDAASDSLRAYELPSFEAVPASEPLELDGSVMALNTAADGRSVLAIVRHSVDRYEVDRVTALCN